MKAFKGNGHGQFKVSAENRWDQREVWIAQRREDCHPEVARLPGIGTATCNGRKQAYNAQ